MRFSDDGASSGGRQLVTFNKTGHATILFIRGTATTTAPATMAGQRVVGVQGSLRSRSAGGASS